MIDGLKPAPAGYAGTMIDAIGCTPLEAVTGPTPPPWLVLATVAAPLVPHEGDVLALADTMATETTSAVEWCAALTVALATPAKPKGDK